MYFVAYKPLWVILMPNPLYTYILNTYDLVWLGFMAYQRLLGYLMSNLVFTYISNICFLNIILLIHTVLNDQSLLFLTIQFSISHWFTLSFKRRTVLFNPLIGLYQVLPLRIKVDVGAMSMKGYSTFPKVPILLESHHLIA